MNTPTKPNALNTGEKIALDRMEEETSLYTLERSVINRLEKEVRAEVIDVSVIESLAKALDIVVYHANRRDDELFRASTL